LNSRMMDPGVAGLPQFSRFALLELDVFFNPPKVNSSFGSLKSFSVTVVSTTAWTISGNVRVPFFGFNIRMDTNTLGARSFSGSILGSVALTVNANLGWAPFVFGVRAPFNIPGQQVEFYVPSFVPSFGEDLETMYGIPPLKKLDLGDLTPGDAAGAAAYFLLKKKESEKLATAQAIARDFLLSSPSTVRGYVAEISNATAKGKILTLAAVLGALGINIPLGAGIPGLPDLASMGIVQCQFEFGGATSLKSFWRLCPRLFGRLWGVCQFKHSRLWWTCSQMATAIVALVA